MVKKNARIAVVAPAGRVNPEQLALPLERLHEKGWQCIPGKHLYSRDGHFTAPRTERLEDLNWALTSPDIDAVWFARGGYGTAQLLSDIAWPAVQPRPVIGFSDATALHIALFDAGMESIHGPVLTTLGVGKDAIDDASWHALGALLDNGMDTPLPGRRLCGPDQPVTGPLIGGNLTVIASLAGTRFAMKAHGSIVILEDVNEAPYRLARSLSQIIESGCLAGATGIALGDFLECGPGASKYQLEDVFAELLEPLSIPVLCGLPVGHGPRNIAFRHGAQAVLDPKIGIVAKARF
jgi:muramoyltetrapeptide carboxypeptidase